MSITSGNIITGGNITQSVSGGVFTHDTEEDIFGADVISALSGGVFSSELSNYSILYRDLAICFDNIIGKKYESDKWIIEALKIVTNLKTTDIDDVTKIIILFSKNINEVYKMLVHYNFSEGQILKTVKVINNYTKENIYPDLTAFVNNIWEDGVPSNWIYLCEMTGEDVSNWNYSS